MSNTIRFTGLSSGLDTQSIVNALMMNYQSKVDTQQQSKQLLELKKDAYKELNMKVNAFYDKYIDNLSISGKLNQTETSVSKEGVISIKESTNASIGNYEIEVNKVATGSTVATQKIPEGWNLEEAWIEASGKAGKTFEISFGEGEEKKTISIDLSEKMKVSELVNAVQDEIHRNGIDAQFTFKDGKFATTMNDPEDKTVIGMDTESQQVIKDITLKNMSLKDINTGATSQDFAMIVGSVEIRIDNVGSMSIGEFEAAVNAKLKEQDLEVNFKFDTKLQAFNISSKNTGEANQIQITEGADLINAKDISISADGKKQAMGSQAQDAEIIYNGITIKQANNTVETEDISFEVLDEGKVSVSTKQDTEAAVSYVKEFVEAYNTLLDELNTKYSADKNTSYKPLTDAQKEEMSDKDIELWNKKIEESLFSGDSTIGDLISTLRNTVEGKISEGGSFNILYDIGISTSNWKEKGKLHLDEDKLIQVLNEQGEGVKELIKDLGSNLRDSLKTTLKSTNDLKSYNSIFNDKLVLEEISTKEKGIKAAQERYDRMEKYYYAKFTAMEKMMNQYNSQSAWLSQ